MASSFAALISAAAAASVLWLYGVDARPAVSVGIVAVAACALCVLVAASNDEHPISRGGW